MRSGSAGRQRRGGECESTHGLDRQLRRHDLLAPARVDDVDGVVLPVGAGDAERDPRPAPEAELALGVELTVEHECAALDPIALSLDLRDPVDIALEEAGPAGRK